MNVIYIFLIFVFSISKAFSVDVIELFQIAKENHLAFSNNKLEIQLRHKDISAREKVLNPTLSLQSLHFYGNKTLIGESGLKRLDNQQNLNLSSTLYQGGLRGTLSDLSKVIPQMAKTQNDIRAIEHFLRINTTYFELMNLLQNEKFLKRQIEGISKRVKTIGQRSKIGMSKKTDYYSNLSQLKRIELSLQSTKQEIYSRKNLLENLIGKTIQVRNLEVSLEKVKKLPEKWKKVGINIPQLEATQISIEEQMLNIEMEQSNYGPRVTLDSNYYLNRRVFGRQDDWDFSINLTWNIFDFGLTKTRVQREKIRLTQLKNTNKILKTEVEIVSDNLERDFFNKLSMEKTLKDALDIANRNYRLHSKEFDKGLINNIELMRAFDDLVIAEQTYSALRFQIAQQYYAMKAFIGDIPL